MPTYHIEKTAAQVALNEDLFKDEQFAKGSNKWRTLKAFGFTGGVAAADAKVDVKISDTIVSDDQPNSSTGTLTDRTEMMIINRAIPPSTPCSCVVVDAGDTNPYHLYVQIEPRKQYRRYTRRYSSRRYSRGND